MKINVEVDCTPAEARAFLGLPDVAPLNEAMVAEMQKRMQANVAGGRIRGINGTAQGGTAHGDLLSAIH